MSTASLTVALAGNPNSGKTTIFNNITGARQHVGNYAGVTIEKREGFRRFQGKDMLMVDLPGTYSLTANSMDELVARNVIIDDKPDIIINILDASNLERNLYLAVQILELERPMALALNMVDVAEQNGLVINEEALSQKLGIPVVRMIGNRNQGTEELLEKVIGIAAENKQSAFVLDYGLEIEASIEKVSAALTTFTDTKYPMRWLAIRLLENDQDVKTAVSNLAGGNRVLAEVDNIIIELKGLLGQEIEIAIAEQRYRFAGEIYSEVVRSSADSKMTVSDKIDKVLTHRLLGLPIFFGIMWLLFNMVFTVGAYPQELVESSIAWFSEAVSATLPDGELKSLLVDGVIGGVGSVIGFLPNIILLFIGIALLEDTGYMARAAFVMDRVMRAVGLNGKAFIPLLVGFGCTVPAVMGTRTLDNPRDRMVTIMVSPLMSCSARLPVYVLLIAVFFSESVAGTVLFSIYFLGILLAVVMAKIFRKWLFPGSTEAFVMEMPAYHLPTWRSVLTHMWERSLLYLKKAGTLILAASILVWFMTNYPSDVSYTKDYDQAKEQVSAAFSLQVTNDILTSLGHESLEDDVALMAAVEQLQAIESQDKETVDVAVLDEQKIVVAQAYPQVYASAEQYLVLESQLEENIAQLEQEQAGEKLAASYAGRLGKVVEPVIQPLGFDWKMGVGLVTAVAAKEVLVSTLGTIYSVSASEDDSVALQELLAADPAFSPLVAFSLMAFTLIYSPCLAALAVVRRETNSWKWTSFTFLYSTGLAWIVSFAIYQVGTSLGF
ncbi:GTPase Der [bioreactor metagenome]|uniref:Ferrous iron transport protein B n=1 Tax=bioreactor metagenome TaxID=1076179 RepID=A0A644TG49_9ZZZZ